jgi:hypothetical protein
MKTEKSAKKNTKSSSNKLDFSSIKNPVKRPKNGTDYGKAAVAALRRAKFD